MFSVKDCMTEISGLRNTILQTKRNVLVVLFMQLGYEKILTWRDQRWSPSNITTTGIHFCKFRQQLIKTRIVLAAVFVYNNEN